MVEIRRMANPSEPHRSPDPRKYALELRSDQSLSRPSAPNPGNIDGSGARRRWYEGFKAADSTNRTYRGVLERFEAYCLLHPALKDAPPTEKAPPPSVVGDYLSHLADTGRKVGTIKHALAALATAYQDVGIGGLSKHPDVRPAWQGIQRKRGAPRQKKLPITPTDFLGYFETLRQDLRGDRTRAMLLLGFYGGFRRSEIVALNVDDVAFTPQGMVIGVGRSKTDQLAEGREKGIPPHRREAICPVRALDRWIKFAKLPPDGALFRPIDQKGNVRLVDYKGRPTRLSDRMVADLVKEAADAAGFDPDRFAAHSLRRGFVTAATRAGKRLDRIMDQTFHEDVQTVRGYQHSARLFEDNAAEGLD
jgi:integrase